MLLGGSAALGLVAEVSERSGGNPYFTELLAPGLDLRRRRAGSEVPPTSRASCCAAWHRLSPITREVMRALAVAGRPATVDRLRASARRPASGRDPR